MTPEEFRRHGHALVDWVAQYLETVGERPVISAAQPGDIRAALPEHPPSAPEPFEDIVADLDRVIVPGLTHWQHPSFFAYFPGNTSYAATLAELVTAGLGVQGMSWVTSPACTEVETLMLDWMQELMGLPASFRSTSERGGGVIQGSASEATLVSMLAARWRASGGRVNQDGDTTRLVAYATEHAHSSIEKGLRIAGIGTDRLRRVPVNTEYAMKPDALQALMAADAEAGLIPFWVCATRGTTGSLAFDPVAEVAAVAKQYGAWVHVDGAMAGMAALSPKMRWVIDGLDQADSFCTNPHKWMGVNFDCDLFWTTDRASLLGALSILPEYLRSAAAESGTAIDYRDWQIPLGRRFRSLKLWFSIRTGGVDDAVDMMHRHVDLTQELARWVGEDERFEIVAPHPLNLLCVRLREGDDATDRLIEAANASGRVHLTRTTLDGSSVLRISVGARTTERHHVEELWDLLQEKTSEILA